MHYLPCYAMQYLQCLYTVSDLFISTPKSYFLQFACKIAPVRFIRRSDNWKSYEWMLMKLERVYRLTKIKYVGKLQYVGMTDVCALLSVLDPHDFHGSQLAQKYNS